MQTILLALAGFLTFGCSSNRPIQSATPANEPMLITDPAQLEGAVGKLVTIQGEVSNTKIPTILGVDVEAEVPDLRGKVGLATGVLEKLTVSQEELDKKIAEVGQFANRGPGIFYRLADPLSGRTVQAKEGPR